MTDEGNTMVLAVKIGAAQQRAQVQVSLSVLAQEHEARDMVGVFRGAQHDVRADNGLDPRSFGCLVELDQGKEIMLIGYRDGRHAQFAGSFNQGFDAHRAIDHRIFGVQVQVDERSGHRQRVAQYGLFAGAKI